ncbi:MAG TPA: hypothetical protein V6D05_10015 [Stenomitos sp.]
MDPATTAYLDHLRHGLEGLGAESVYLAKLILPRARVEARSPEVDWDQPTVTDLRSCLMKPEHRAQVPWLHDRVEALAAIP